MNSEELELSLRTEFENYLNDTFGEMRSELTDLQAKVTAEIEKHKQQLEAVFQNAATRMPERREIDPGFKDAVLEHLRLARDEGASITAAAIAEAEEMERQSAGAKVGFAEMRKAIDEISGKTSQSEILKSLVAHAELFAPRGAFFIVKNEHFVGWKTFGAEKGDTEDTVRDIFFPVSADSILSTAVRSLATVESNAATHSKDKDFLEKLKYGAPGEMYAIPLIARGRGVAVLYADRGAQGKTFDTDALETLVRVAGLAVEVLASAKGSAKKKAAAETVTESAGTGFRMPPTAPAVNRYDSSFEETPAFNPTYESPSTYQPSYQPETDVRSFDSYNQAKEEPAYYPPVADSFDDTPATESDAYTIDYEEATAATQTPVVETPNAYTSSSYAEEPVTTNDYTNDYSNDYTIDYRETVESDDFGMTKPAVPEFKSDYSSDFSFSAKTEPAQEPVRDYAGGYEFEEPAVPETPAPQAFESYTPAPEPAKDSFSFEANRETEFVAPPVVQAPPAPAAPTRSRFSDRNVDLPIEVTEDERRLHNDARRFARLLVSEIKLYNEAKVKEGRESNDLYERLREAIDRSREMYDKRVQPNVAAKFDYFHYELVNSLGEGDESRLGSSYPGATV